MSKITTTMTACAALLALGSTGVLAASSAGKTPPVRSAASLACSQ